MSESPDKPKYPEGAMSDDKPIPNDYRKPPRFGMFNVKEGTGTIYDLHELKTERDAAIKERDKFKDDALAWNKAYHEALKERDELREKLKVAREALRIAVKARYISSPDRIQVEEALKQIGE